MSSFVRVAVSVFLVLALLATLVGCAPQAQPSPTTAPTKAAEPTKAPAATPAAQAKPTEVVIELKYHHHDPPESYQAKNGHQKWADLVAEKTNGRVKVVVYPGETLGKAANAYDMVVNGVADIGWGYLALFPGRFPVTDLIALPMLGMKSGVHGSKVAQEMYSTTPEIQKEFAQVHILFVHTVAPHLLGFTKKKVQTMEDLKGLRLRSMSGAPLKFLQGLGATPVTVPMPEIFEALQKGTIDGYATDWAGAYSFRFLDISKYVLECYPYVPVFFLAMNQKKWDSLPPDIQKTITELSGQFGAQMYGRTFDEASAVGKTEAPKKGVEVLQLSDQERKRWEQVATPIWDEWVKSVESKGVNGKALLDKIKQVVEKNK